MDNKKKEAAVPENETVGEENIIEEIEQTEVETAEQTEKTEQVEEQVDDELALLKKELDSQKDTLMRTAAEFANYRKRTDKEKSDSISYGTQVAVKAILPVFDNLERAAEAESVDADYKKGVEMTLSLFRKSLADLGVTEIEALGSDFDPLVHNAVMQEESGEYESGKVTKVLQKGYKLHDKVIRPSMVAVAQ